MADTRDMLRDVQRRLLRQYGPQHWWPADSPFEVMVGAVLTQSTSWTNVEKAVASLKAAVALSPPGDPAAVPRGAGDASSTPPASTTRRRASSRRWPSTWATASTTISTP